MTGRALVALAGLALTGCGADPTAPAADAGRADAGLDGGPGVATVDVLALDEGDGQPLAPAVGAPVIFVGPDGDEQSVVTDERGHAEAVIAPDSTVFVLRTHRFDSRRQLTAYRAIDPGMALAVGAPPRFALPFPNDVGFVQVELPPVPDATFYTASVSCQLFGGASSVPPLFVDVRRCPRLAHATIVTSASVEGRLVAYGVAEDVDLRSTTFDGAIEVPAVRAPAAAIASFTSIPPEVALLQLTQTHLDGDIAVTAQSEAVRPGGSVATFALPVAPIGDRTRVRVALVGADLLGAIAYLRRYDGAHLSTRIDLGATMLSFMTPPVLTLATRTAVWSYGGGSGRRPDLVAIRGDYVAEPGIGVAFALYGPGDRTSLTLPRFPAALASVRPTPDETAVVADYYGVDVVGRDFAALIEHADADARLLFARDDAYADAGEVWITGRD